MDASTSAPVPQDASVPTPSAEASSVEVPTHPETSSVEVPTPSAETSSVEVPTHPETSSVEVPTHPETSSVEVPTHPETSSVEVPTHPDPIVACTTDLSEQYQRLSALAETPVITLEQVQSLSKVALTDEDNGLSMYCYTRDCDAAVADSLTQECRGVVFDESGKLVSRAFGYTPMYSSYEDASANGNGSWANASEINAADLNPVPADIKEFISEHLAECKVYPAFEGALVRVFNHNGKWYLTTHRKLDAFRSYWGSRTSFGDMFMDALDTACEHCPELAEKCPKEIRLEAFYHLLNEQRQYVFLVLNTMENRIVCYPPQQPCAIHVATFENGVQVEETIPGILAQSPIQGLESYNHLLQLVNSMNPHQYQGVVVFMPNGKQVKICSTVYLALFNLRGNEASVMFRYLQIRDEHAAEYKALYPEHAFRFAQYENVLLEVAKSILKSYRDRFINREHIVLPQEEFTVMSEVHEWYKGERAAGKQTKVRLTDVQAILNDQPATALNKMIRRVLEASK